MKGKILFLITLLGLFVSSPAFANSYDDDERIRRDAQKLVDQDKQERDAAKQRADDAERANSHSSGDGGGIGIFLILIGVVAGIWHFNKK